MEKSNITTFSISEGSSIEVKLKSDTVWLSQKQMGELFEKDSDTIGVHLRNIYKSEELDEKSTTEKSSVVRQEGKRNVKRQIKFYNLDAIISVGYRVNSKRGVIFRKWATQLLKDYLIKGFALNQAKLESQNKQLSELKKTVLILSESLTHRELSNDESKGLLQIISEYSYALDILDQYDYQTLAVTDTSDYETYKITYKEAKSQIELTRRTFGNSALFGQEKDDSFKSSIATIYQTFGDTELYKSIEEKAANLLYFIVKNHSFTDGNKRIAAFIFLYFLEKNHILYNSDGKKRIADNTLVALTLMIAVSKPDEKETMIKVVINLINKRNNTLA